MLASFARYKRFRGHSRDVLKRASQPAVESLESRVLLSVAYTATDLGSLGGSGTVPSAINDAGQVTGSSTSANGDGHAFLWADGTMRDLGALPGGAASFGAAINSQGIVAGSSGAAADVYGFDHAFVTNGATLTDLGTLPGYVASNAQGINASGQIVGLQQDGSPGGSRAFLYTGGQMVDLSGLFAGSSAAYAINDVGEVAGSGVQTAGGQPSAFIYSGGKVNFLGRLSGDTSTAYAINSRGDVAGSVFLPNIGETAAFLFVNAQTIYLSGPGLRATRASAINNSDVAVGDAELYDPTNAKSYQHAFVYQGSGATQDLNTLVSPQVGHTLISATGVNSAGQIIAISSDSHAFLLTPVPGGSISGTIYKVLPAFA
ncbi:MAG TPA: hypothetical protein VFC78_16915 [Tepidisphaeraceae bacterium]|nr:hypothetical protein [Tepidisphaeraceae bacterium]